MFPTTRDLVVFLKSLEDELLLPALWLVRRSDLGALLDDQPLDERLLELVEDRLFTQDRRLYEFVMERRREN